MTLRHHEQVEVVTSEKRFSGRIFEVVVQSIRLPSGLRQNLELVSHPGAVAIAASDALGRLLVVRQYRAAVGDWTLEIPAGRLDPGESPLEAARRELEEETGYRAAHWRHVRSFFPAPGFLSEKLHLFRAEELEAVPGGGSDADPDEELEVRWATAEELAAEPNSDAKTLLALELI